MKHKLFDQVYPYTYYIKRLSDGVQYYGSRYGNVKLGKTPLEDLGKLYFSSGKFKLEFEDSPQSYEFKICHTFDSVGECVNYELKIISKIYKRKNWCNLNKNHFPVLDLSECRRKSMLIKYGVDHNFKIESVKQNRKVTFLKKYGVDNPTRSETIMEKMRRTNLKKFGVEWSVESDVIKSKIKSTFLKKYGVDNPNKYEGVRNKKMATNMIRYGVPHNFQSLDVINKIHEKRKDMYIRLSKMSDLEFSNYLSTISQNKSVQSQKKTQRKKGVELTDKLCGVIS